METINIRDEMSAQILVHSHIEILCSHKVNAYEFLLTWKNPYMIMLSDKK